MGACVTPGLASLDAKRAAIGTITAGAVAVGVDTTDWTIIAGGLLIGIMARWAVMLNSQQPVGWREVRIDALVLLANGLLAAQFGEVFHLHGVKLAVAAALFGASSTTIFSALHRRFVEQTASHPTTIFAGPGTVTHVPHHAPDVEVHAIEADPPAPLARTLRALNRTPLPPAPDLDALIDKLDDAKD